MANYGQRPYDRYVEILKHMPLGLSRAILRTVSFHEGKDQAIFKAKIWAELQQIGFLNDCHYSTAERQIRDTISDMNLDEANDILILGSTGEGGYYIPASWEEYAEYYNVEKHRADEITSKLDVMSKKAVRLFKNWSGSAEKATQTSLF